jgi:hypothetical protein
MPYINHEGHRQMDEKKPHRTEFFISGTKITTRQIDEKNRETGIEDG